MTKGSAVEIDGHVFRSRLEAIWYNFIKTIFKCPDQEARVQPEPQFDNSNGYEPDQQITYGFSNTIITEIKPFSEAKDFNGQGIQELKEKIKKSLIMNHLNAKNWPFLILGEHPLIITPGKRLLAGYQVIYDEMKYRLKPAYWVVPKKDSSLVDLHVPTANKDLSLFFKFKNDEASVDTPPPHLIKKINTRWNEAQNHPAIRSNSPSAKKPLPKHGGLCGDCFCRSVEDWKKQLDIPTVDYKVNLKYCSVCGNIKLYKISLMGTFIYLRDHKAPSGRDPRFETIKETHDTLGYATPDSRNPAIKAHFANSHNKKKKT
jgi:hypothetical protein